MIKIFLTSALLLIAGLTYSQKTELGVSLGGSLFKGDINSDLSLKEIKPSIGLNLKYHLSDKFTIRPSLLFTTLSGNDFDNMSFSDEEVFDKYRNLSFRSRIYELSFSAEYSFKNLLEKKSSPYIFGGIGIFYFNPEAKYQGKWYDLQPLGTEGQGLPGYSKRYKRIQPCLLLGLGYKFKISQRIYLGLEAGLRLTNTDYIDDVSKTYVDKNTLKANGEMAVILSDRTMELPVYEPPSKLRTPHQPGEARGNSKNKDKYLLINFSLSYRIFKSPPPNPKN